MYIYIYIYKYTYTQTKKYIYIYIIELITKFIYIYIYMYTYLQIYMYVSMQLSRTHLFMHACMHSPSSLLDRSRNLRLLAEVQRCHVAFARCRLGDSVLGVCRL